MNMKKRFPKFPDMIPFKKFIPGIAWFFLSLILICTPSSDLPKPDTWMNAIFFDKWIHLGLFAVLAFLFMLPVIKSQIDKKNKFRLLIRIAICVSLWGLVTEQIQESLIRGRGFEWGDWAADSIGSLGAFLISRSKYLQARLNKA